MSAGTIIVRQDAYGAPVTVYRSGVVVAENVPPEVIAAAPEMLEALRDAESLIAVVVEEHRRKGETNSERVALRTLTNLRAAIAKATRGTP